MDRYNATIAILCVIFFVRSGLGLIDFVDRIESGFIYSLYIVLDLALHRNRDALVRAHFVSPRSININACLHR